MFFGVDTVKGECESDKAFPNLERILNTVLTVREERKMGIYTYPTTGCYCIFDRFGNKAPDPTEKFYEFVEKDLPARSVIYKYLPQVKLLSE